LKANHAPDMGRAALVASPARPSGLIAGVRRKIGADDHVLALVEERCSAQ
jgi:hypothetical protein